MQDSLASVQVIGRADFTFPHAIEGSRAAEIDRIYHENGFTPALAQNLRWQRV